MRVFPEDSSSSPPILIIGNSDGIGLATTRQLLARGQRVVGLSRSESTLGGSVEGGAAGYQHIVCNVIGTKFPEELRALLLENPDLKTVIHCAGVGSSFDAGDLSGELECFRTNLLSVVELAAVMVPWWRDHEGGHLVVLSSVADSFVVPDAPSYGASKAGLSRYLRALGLRLRGEGIDVTNVRFGFVDTKMAQAAVKPFEMTVDRAARVVLEVLRSKPPVRTRPRIVALVGIGLEWAQRVQLLIGAAARPFVPGRSRRAP